MTREQCIEEFLPAGMAPLLDQLQAGIVVYRAHQTGGEVGLEVYAANDYICHLLEISKPVLLAARKNQIFAMVFYEDMEAVRALGRQLLYGEEQNGEARFRLITRENRKVISVQLKAHSRRLPDGDYLCYCTYFDITGAQRHQEDYQQRIGSLLHGNPRNLCAFHLDLTGNLCLEKSGVEEYTAQLQDSVTVDGLLNNMSDIIADKVMSNTFRLNFSRVRLLKVYEQGTRHLTYCYPRLTASDRVVWVRTSFQLLLEPNKGHVEAVAYSVDFEREHMEEVILSSIAEDDYEAISTVEVSTGVSTCYMWRGGEAADGPIGPVHESTFEAHREVLLGLIDTEAEREQMARDFTIPGIVAALVEAPQVSYTYQARGRHERLSCRYLDENRDRLLFTRRDVTLEVREKEENAQLIRRALDEATKANQLKAAFFSNASHDLRTPLNAILGYQNLALRQPGVPDVVRNYLEKIRRAGQGMLLLVNDILDLQRIGNSAAPFILRPIRLKVFLRSLVNGAQAMAGQKGLTLRYEDIGVGDACIQLDPIYFRQVFIQLVSNACTYTPSGGTVEIRVQKLKDLDTALDFKLTVRDTGIGMSREFAAGTLFEPFSQERREELIHKLNPNGRPLGESGLGLAMVKSIVDRMGGRILVHSRLGGGTQISVRLTCQLAEPEQFVEETVEGWGEDDVTTGREAADSTGTEEAEAGQGVDDAKPLRGMRILLCEDNEMNAEIAEIVLADAGAKVEVAADGEAGLRLYRGHEPRHYDIVLMDIRMPKMDGYIAAQSIRASRRPDANTIPILGQSADAYDTDRDHALASGMDGYLVKPLQPEIVIAEILRLVKGP